MKENVSHTNVILAVTGKVMELTLRNTFQIQLNLSIQQNYILCVCTCLPSTDVTSRHVYIVCLHTVASHSAVCRPCLVGQVNCVLASFPGHLSCTHKNRANGKKRRKRGRVGALCPKLANVVWHNALWLFMS